MVRGLGGHFCFDFFRLRFFAAISIAVLTTTGAPIGPEVRVNAEDGGGGGGGGGGGAIAFSFFTTTGGRGGGGGGEGSIAAGEATELRELGLEAIVDGLPPWQAAEVSAEPEHVPGTTPLVLDPSSDPSWLGDSPPIQMSSSKKQN